jgi:hypothetical protein
MKLALGIVDIPEIGSDIGTHDLAMILEKKYGIFSTFAKVNAPFIAQQLTKSLTNQVSNMLAGRKPSADPFAEGTDKITRRFQDMLNEKGFNNTAPGIPTLMALMNKSRIKNARRRSTASFIDQGVFQSQLRTWVRKE